MLKKYEVHDQLTGLPEEAATWEEAQQLQARIRAKYIAERVDPLFQISVLLQNEDQSWTYALADKNGAPITMPDDGKQYQWDEAAGAWVEAQE